MESPQEATQHCDAGDQQNGGGDVSGEDPIGTASSYAQDTTPSTPMMPRPPKRSRTHLRFSHAGVVTPHAIDSTHGLDSVMRPPIFEETRFRNRSNQPLTAESGDRWGLIIVPIRENPRRSEQRGDGKRIDIEQESAPLVYSTQVHNRHLR
jgi:hypothetical protein